MSLEAIKALPVADWAAGGCVLFLWATNPLLELAFEVARAWGSAPKTLGFCWAKRNPRGDGFATGLGFWTRSNAELCLLATRGRPKRRAADLPQLVVAPRREHSRKPEEVRERIERLVDGALPRAVRAGVAAALGRVGREGGACSTRARWRPGVGRRRAATQLPPGRPPTRSGGAGRADRPLPLGRGLTPEADGFFHQTGAGAVPMVSTGDKQTSRFKGFAAGRLPRHAAGQAGAPDGGTFARYVMAVLACGGFAGLEPWRGTG